MPYRRRFKRRYRRRRRYRRSRRRRRRRARGGRITFTKIRSYITPDQMYTKIPWFELYDEIAQAPPLYYRFQVNDLANCQSIPPVLVQTEPQGFAQYNALYKNWHVMGAKCTMQVINLSDQDQVEATMYFNNDADIELDPLNIWTYAQSTRMICSQANAGGNIKRRTMFRSIRKIIGKTANDADYSGQNETSPLKIANMFITIASPDSQTVNLTYQLRVTIVFYVKWWSRRNLDFTTS